MGNNISVFMEIVHIASYSMYAESKFRALDHGGRALAANTLCVRTPKSRRLKRTQTVFPKNLNRRSTCQGCCFFLSLFLPKRKSECI
jgi:hypothetical protein